MTGMDSDKLVVQIYTDLSLSDSQICQILWKHLDSQHVRPTAYDAVEQAEREFHSDSHSDASELFAEHNRLFVLGARHDFIAMFANVGNGLSRWNFWRFIDEREHQLDQEWLSWLYGLLEALPTVFASVCSKTEYEAKHRYTQAHDTLPKVRVRGSIGDSIPDFYKALPGIYWLTIFGSDLVEGFTRSRLFAVPATTATPIGSEQVALQLDAPLIPSSIEERLGVENEVAAFLGKQYFFDRSTPEAEVTPIPELARKLQQIAGR